MSSVIGVQPSLGATLSSSTCMNEKDTPHTNSKTSTIIHTTITNMYSLISKTTLWDPHKIFCPL